jgi:hypothetical protein
MDITKHSLIVQTNRVMIGLERKSSENSIVTLLFTGSLSWSGAPPFIGEWHLFVSYFSWNITTLHSYLMTFIHASSILLISYTCYTVYTLYTGPVIKILVVDIQAALHLSISFFVYLNSHSLVFDRKEVEMLYWLMLNMLLIQHILRMWVWMWITYLSASLIMGRWLWRVGVLFIIICQLHDCNLPIHKFLERFKIFNNMCLFSCWSTL